MYMHRQSFFIINNYSLVQVKNEKNISFIRKNKIEIENLKYRDSY